MAKKKKTKTKTKRQTAAARQRSLDNIKPHEFKPGQSGNPAGPPIARLHLKTRAFKFAQMPVDTVKKLAEEVSAGTSKLCLADIAALRWMMDASGGKWPQMLEFLNRDEGKVADKVIQGSVDLAMTAEDAAKVLGILDERGKEDVVKK